MRYSRIYLAGSSCLLAIVSVAAVKSINFGSTPGFFITYDDTACKQLPSSKCHKVTPMNKTCLTTLVKPNGVTQYVTFVFTDPECANKLHYSIL